MHAAAEKTIRLGRGVDLLKIKKGMPPPKEIRVQKTGGILPNSNTKPNFWFARLGFFILSVLSAIF